MNLPRVIGSRLLFFTLSLGTGLLLPSCCELFGDCEEPEVLPKTGTDPDPGPSDPGDPTPSSSPLGNIDAEVAYVETSGNGTVLETFNNPATPDPCCFASVLNGQRLINYQPAFNQFPLGTQALFRAHEFGHHYLRHEATPPNGFTKEYEADAFGIRVLAATQGPVAARAAIDSVIQNPNSGDATHPTSADRAAYMSQVLTAFQSSPNSVPPTPGTPAVAGVGALVITNTVFEPGFVYVNQFFAATLAPGQSLTLELTPGFYRVDLQGTNTLLFYAPAFATVTAGQQVFLP